MYKLGVKRLMDIAFGCFLLFLSSPFLIVSALAVALDSRGPVLFRQMRLGRNGGTFLLYKFRTMSDKPRSVSSEVLQDHAEVTRVGRWLRRLKIDELPQLFNVVLGDMSLVGPRPAMPDQISLYDQTARRRLDVRPGLTGLAQVNGNIFISWPERWRLDVEYVDKLTFWLDAKILMKTALVVLLGEERFIPRKSSGKCA